MKKLLFLLVAAVGIAAASFVAAVGIAAASFAAELSYSPALPQDTDSNTVILHKSQVAMAKLAAGNSASNIVATGTSSVAAKMLERLVVNTAGSADSKMVLKSGTVTLGTASTAAQASLGYNIAIASGTLTVITTGTTAPDVTLSYR